MLYDNLFICELLMVAFFFFAQCDTRFILPFFFRDVVLTTAVPSCVTTPRLVHPTCWCTQLAPSLGVDWLPENMGMTTPKHKSFFPYSSTGMYARSWSVSTYHVCTSPFPVPGLCSTPSSRCCRLLFLSSLVDVRTKLIGLLPPFPFAPASLVSSPRTPAFSTYHVCPILPYPSIHPPGL